jgi:antitoxin HicB
MEKKETKLQYYLKQPYSIKIDPIPEEEGGGFFASLPQFGSMGITGDGDTIEEAIEMLQAFKEIQFKKYIKENRKIPEAAEEKQIDKYSGRILLRTPKELHKDIAQGACKNGVSQNQYANHLLTKAINDIRITDIDDLFSKFTKVLNQIYTALNTGHYQKKQYDSDNIYIENNKEKTLSKSKYADAYRKAA